MNVWKHLPRAPRAMLALCQRFEGCFLRAYLCPARVWTCGWGATGLDVTPTTRWTQIQADARLERDAWNHYREACRISPVLWLVPDEVAAAIADFVFNLGPGAYRGSTLRKCVDAQNWTRVSQELTKWVFGGGRKLPGLVLRRHAEATLILNAMKDAPP